MRAKARFGPGFRPRYICEIALAIAASLAAIGPAGGAVLGADVGTVAAVGEASPAGASPGSGAALETLFVQWQARQRDIVTANVRYRCFHNGVEGGRTPSELEDLLSAGLLDGTPEGFREFIAAMHGGPFPLDPPWGDGKIIVRDTQRRNDLGPFTTIEDREICVDWDSLNNQYDVSSAGGSRRRSDDLFLFRPLPPSPWTADRWQLVDSAMGAEAGALRARRLISPPGAEPPRFDQRTYEFDSQTGLTTRIVRTNDAGEVVSLARYLDPVELAGGVMFPRIVVEALFKEGIATVLHVCVIDAISVNEPTGDHEFHLPAAGNSLLVDHRGPEKVVSRLDRPQADVVGWLKQHAPVMAEPPPRPGSSGGSVRNLLLTGNGLLLIVIGAARWKRQRVLRPPERQQADRPQPDRSPPSNRLAEVRSSGGHQ